MKKNITAKIGIKELTISKLMCKDQVDAIMDDFEKNESKLLKTEGMQIRGGNRNKECLFGAYYKAKGKNVTFDLDLYNRYDCLDTDDDCYEIEVMIESTSPLELIIQKEVDIEKIISEYNKFIKMISNSIPMFSTLAYPGFQFLDPAHKGYTIDLIEYGTFYDLIELHQEHIADKLWKMTKSGYWGYRALDSKYAPLYGDPASKLKCDKRYFELNDSYTQVYATHYLDHQNKDSKLSTNVIYFGVQKSHDHITGSAWNSDAVVFESELNKAGGYISAMKYLLSEKRAKIVVKRYMENHLILGDYYSITGAIGAVEDSDFSQEKKLKMIVALQYIHNSGGIYDARRYIVDNQLIFPDFNRSIDDLISIGINPNTYSDKWEILMIPGLMSFYDL